MEGHPPARILSARKVGKMASTCSAASTATGASSCGGSTHGGSDIGEDYYENFATWQAAENGWNSMPSHFKASIAGNSPASELDKAAMRSRGPTLKLGKTRLNGGSKKSSEAAKGNGRHWLLPPPVESRQEEEAEDITLQPKKPTGQQEEAEDVAVQPKKPAGPLQQTRTKPPKEPSVRHWMLDMLDPPAGLEQDSAVPPSYHAADVKADPNLYENFTEEDCLGRWLYPGCFYTVDRVADGSLRFEYWLANGGSVAGAVRPCGQWLEGEVYSKQAEHAGTIRLRPGGEPGTLISNFRAAPKLQVSGALVAAQADWGPDVVANREELTPCPMRPRQPEPGAAPQQKVVLFAGQLDLCDGLCSRCSAAAQGPGALAVVPVKHTFIQFDEPKDINMPRSSPAILASGPFKMKESELLPTPAKMEQAHSNGNCRPCAYFWGKKDGCRAGKDCKFCHLCQPGELKRRRREKDRMLRVQQRASRTAPAA